MKNKKIQLSIILVILNIFTGCAKEIPAFSGEEAFAYLTKQTDFGPRNPGSTGHEQCLNFLSSELALFADKVLHQPFEFTDTIIDSTYNMTNVIASFNMNPASGKRIMLCAHWDTRPRADMDDDPANKNIPIIGANDGASGVAVLLQIAKIMKDFPPSIGVDIVLFDGEDYGESGNLDYYFLGARHFTKTMGNYKPGYAVLLDMVGDKDQSFPPEGHSMSYAAEQTRMIWNKAKELNLTQFTDIGGSTINDDHLILNQAGIPSVDIIDFDYPYWHTIEDTPDKCSAESLENVGKLLLALIYE